MWPQYLLQPPLLLLWDIRGWVTRLKAKGWGVGRRHYRYTKYADCPNENTRGGSLEFFHPETRFQNSAFTGSMWTIGQNNTKHLRLHTRVFPYGRPLTHRLCQIRVRCLTSLPRSCRTAAWNCIGAVTQQTRIWIPHQSSQHLPSHLHMNAHTHIISTLMVALPYCPCKRTSKGDLTIFVLPS